MSGDILFQNKPPQITGSTTICDLFFSIVQHYPKRVPFSAIDGSFPLLAKLIYFDYSPNDGLSIGQSVLLFYPKYIVLTS